MNLLLKLDDVHAAYGPVAALSGISLEVNQGEIVTLIGSNGAGKSTTLRAISGLLKPRAGAIHFAGRKIDGLSPSLIVRLGICHAPEGRKIFPRLSVLENLEMGAYTRDDTQGIRRDLDRAFDFFPLLRERRKQAGGTLSGGEQQMLAVARALMGNPKILLLDEPSLGLAPLVVSRIFEVLKRLNSEGMSILLVEQNARLALKLAHRGYVIETGQITLTDAADKLLHNDGVREAYLGE